MKSFIGTSCAICGLKYRKGLKFIRHHITYDPPMIVIVCAKCHLWWHGSGKVFKHPFMAEGRDIGPLKFFHTAIKLYEEGHK